MKLTGFPGMHPLSFAHRFGPSYSPFINRSFMLGRDPMDDLHMTKSSLPPVNILREEDYYELEIPVPGFKREEIEVLVADNILTIKGKREKSVEKASTYIRVEHDTDEFERSFELTNEADQEKINARLEDGILYVRINRIREGQEKSKGRTIEVN